MSSSTPTIAIFTASSTSGTACIEALLASPNAPNIRAIYRSEAKAAVLRRTHNTAPNVSIITGIDARDKSTLVPALQGATIAFLVTPFDHAHGVADDAEMVSNMMYAAVEAGVKHIIFGASWTVRAADRLVLLAARFAPGEALLRKLEHEKGITWTVLRGGFFHSSYMHFFQTAKDSQFRFLDFCAPSNDPNDIGRVAAAIASSNVKAHHGKLYEISGPERLWIRDVVTTITQYVQVSVEECTKMMPLFLKQAFEYIVEAGEDAIPMSTDVERITGKPPVSFREWLMKSKQRFE